MRVKHGDRVRLVRGIEGLPAGSVGRIFGYLHRPEGDAFAVGFDRAPSRFLPPDELAVVSEDVIIHALTQPNKHLGHY
jgi:hypothetical protein